MGRTSGSDTGELPVRVSVGSVVLEGSLDVPDEARGVVLFAHGSGSGRHSPRNRYVARTLREANLATLLIDLLTVEEEEMDLHTRQLRFDIGLLAQRLVGATDWIAQNLETQNIPVGYFGASTGAGAALVAGQSVRSSSPRSSRAAVAQTWRETPYPASRRPRL